MRMSDVETHLLEVPREVEAADSRHVFDRWYVTAIEIGTDERLTGLGWMASICAGAVFRHLLDDQFVPLLADRSPFETEAILDEPPVVEDGRVHLPDRPGHGYRLDREAVEAFAVGSDTDDRSASPG